jgi:DnaJ-class molecular chaperone
VLCLVSLCLLAMSVSAFEADDNYYKILGVNRNATVKEIKKAYHKMSLEYHPDRNKSPNARDKFATIAEAYEVLKDQEKRQTYDRHGKEGVQRASRGDDGADPFQQFEDMFGGGFGGMGGGRRGGGRRQQRRKGPELNTKIRLTLEELYSGREIPFLMSKTVVCEHCRGSGTHYSFFWTLRAAKFFIEENKI